MTKKESSFDCSRFVPHECKCFCCGPVPVLKETYEANKHLRFRPVLRELDHGDHIFPDTGQQYCTFLSDDFQCLIYDNRPQVCQDFGKLDSPLMKCPYMDKSGKNRTTKDQKKVADDFYAALDQAKSETDDGSLKDFFSFSS